jgi:hypothetical protein
MKAAQERVFAFIFLYGALAINRSFSSSVLKRNIIKMTAAFIPAF